MPSAVAFRTSTRPAPAALVSSSPAQARSANTLTYSFQEYSPDIPAGDIRWAIDQALGLWSAETPLRFRRVADGTSGDIVIHFVSGNHADGSPFDGPSNVLAHAFYPFNPDPIKGDTHFDEPRPGRWPSKRRPADRSRRCGRPRGRHALGLSTRQCRRR